MKAKEIQDLINFIKDTGMDEVNIETDQFKLSVKRNSGIANVISSTPVAQVSAPPVPPAASTSQTTKNEGGGDDESKYQTIKSPMIGTFYRSENPESDPFVNVGDKIAKGKAVCIIEAMKLFNEIESEISGTIVKVLVDNSTPVEYDQPLFLVEPS
jgi:acetyl-CoA carboxylase biotin carboxyl carrier protein